MKQFTIHIGSFADIRDFVALAIAAAKKRGEG